MSDFEKARWIHLGLVAFALLSLGVSLTFTPVTASPSTEFWIFSVLALWCVRSGFYFRRKFMRENGAVKGLDGKTRKSWLIGQLNSWACAEAIVLYGFVANMKTLRAYAIPFFVVGTALLLLWTPRSNSVPNAD